MIVTLERFCDSEEEGTFGILKIDYLEFVTVERPWDDNEPNISCIPTGKYVCKRVNSPKFGNTFEILDVEDRTNILFHPANTMKDIEGCIGIGTRLGCINQHWAVIQSRNATTKFLNYFFDVDEFKLEITWKN